MTDNINIEKIIKHWQDSSEKDYKTMLHLFKSKDYGWSLFLGHLVLEKLLKASVVKIRNEHAPFTHDLSKLAIYSEIEFSEEQLDWFDTITTFNLNARYDSYKMAFYKKCTVEYTFVWSKRIKQLRTWIKAKQ